MGREHSLAGADCQRGIYGRGREVLLEFQPDQFRRSGPRAGRGFSQGVVGGLPPGAGPETGCCAGAWRRGCWRESFHQGMKIFCRIRVEVLDMGRAGD